MTNEDPAPPQAADCSAHVAIENKSSHLFKFQVLHQYTGEEVQDSGWHLMKPNEKKTVLDVNYRVGIWTTGVDNWKVHGLKMIETHDQKGEKIEDKRYFGESWRSGTGAAGTDWKKHTLRSEDNGKLTTVKVFEKEIQFVSPSGTSTTDFYRHDQ